MPATRHMPTWQWPAWFSWDLLVLLVFHRLDLSRFYMLTFLNCSRPVYWMKLIETTPRWPSKQSWLTHVICMVLMQFMPLLASSEHFFEPVWSRYHQDQLEFDATAKLLISWQHITFFPLLMIARYGTFCTWQANAMNVMNASHNSKNCFLSWIDLQIWRNGSCPVSSYFTVIRERKTGWNSEGSLSLHDDTLGGPYLWEMLVKLAQNPCQILS